MAVNVRLWSAVPNPAGVPGAWPETSIEVPDGSPAPAAPWQQMTDAAFAAYVAANEAVYNTWAAAQVVVPPTIYSWQAKIVLAATPSPKNAGKMCLDDVNALLSAASTTDQIAWANAATFGRGSPLLNALAAQIGLTSAQVDAMFVQAAAIEV